MGNAKRNILTSEQAHFYKENGYLLPQKKLFSNKKFSALKNIFEELLNIKGNRDGNELDVPHFFDSRLFEFLLANEVLDIVEQIIGPNIGLWSSHFICKEAKTGKRTPWHEDSAYWAGRFNRYDTILTVWLAIDSASTENGCMGVIPGTHTNGFSEYTQLDTDHKIFNIEISDDKIDADEIVWFELEPNTFSLHDSRIIHGANANNSNSRRTGYTMRYFSTDLEFAQNHPENQHHKIYHCRGENPGKNPLIYL